LLFIARLRQLGGPGLLLGRGRRKLDLRARMSAAQRECNDHKREKAEHRQAEIQWMSHSLAEGEAQAKSCATFIRSGKK
jgi:septum formation inhibitor MinC